MKSTYEIMGGNYQQNGDYLLPDFEVPEYPKVGVWGERRRKYLREHQKALYTALMLSDTLNAHLEEVDRSASEMHDRLTSQLAKQEGVTEQLKAYIDILPFDSGDSECKTVLDQLYQAYAESHESDPPEISDGFKELEEFLCTLPLEENNAVFNLCCRSCCAYERKAFIDGLPYGAHLMSELR